MWSVGMGPARGWAWALHETSMEREEWESGIRDWEDCGPHSPPPPTQQGVGADCGVIGELWPLL